MAAVRLFLALWPEPEVRSALAAWRDGWHWPRQAAPVPDEKLHLTLHFLGPVDAARVPALGAACRVGFTPFQLDLGMPRVWHDSVAVLEPLAIPDALRALHADLGAQLRALGMAPEERPYRPHVTMARRAGGAAAPATGPALHWPIGGYALVQSHLDGSGQYQVLQRY